MRVGQGFDVHAFCDGDHLQLGGVRIPFTRAFNAHSDGDVLLHAISDALLGAASLGDIGRHFPDTDPQYAGIDSRKLLRNIVKQLATKHFVCISVDATIIAQAPAMAPHINGMISNLAEDLGLSAQRINVKATTTERLGYCGRGEGIAAMASVLLDETAA